MEAQPAVAITATRPAGEAEAGEEEPADELRRRLDELEAENARLRRLLGHGEERPTPHAAEVLESIGDAFYSLDRDLRFTYVNRRALEVWNRSAADVLGRPAFDVFPEARGSEIHRAILEAVETGETVRLECVSPILHRWVALSVHPSASGLAVYFRDVSERRQAEAGLRDAAERLAFALEAARMGDWSWDAASDAVELSDRAAEIFGLPPGARRLTWDDMRGRLLHPDDRERVRLAVEEAVAAHGRYDVEYRVVRPVDGTLAWIAARGRAHYGPDGRVLGMGGVVLDVTGRKRVERRMATEHAVSQALAEASDLREAATPMLERLCRTLGADVGELWLTDAGDDRLHCAAFHVAGSWRPERFREATLGAALARGEGLMGQVWATGGPAWASDLARDLSRARAAAAEADGLRTAFAFPVTVDGECAGVVAFASRQVLPRDEPLLAMAASVGRHIGEFLKRSRAEERLRVSEARLRAVIESLPFDLWVCDRNGRYLLQNSTARRNWGDVVGRMPEDTDAPPEVLAEWRADNARALAGETVRGEATYPGPGDGPPRHVEKVLAPIESGGIILGHVGVNVDVTERKRAEAALRESEARRAAEVERERRRLELTLDNLAEGVTAFFLDTGAVIRNRGWLRFHGFESLAQLPGPGVEDVASLFEIRDAEGRVLPVEEIPLSRALSGETFEELEIKLRRLDDGREWWGSYNGTALRDEDGNIVAALISMRDVTERKSAAERQRLLLAELSHRVKNTLAVVQSIASQSLAGGRTLAEAREAFTKRLHALASAHTLLTASEWRGASLRTLATDGLEPYGDRIALEGRDLTLGPKAALTLGLVLHELATNAAKHGALSLPEGRVSLVWSTSGRIFRLRWTERGGPEVRPPERRGFGRTLVERVVAHDLGGHARLDFRPEGVVYEVEAPLERATAAA